MNILKVDFLSELGSIDIINDYAICQLLRSKIHIWQTDSVKVQFLQVMSIIINNLQTMLKVISDYAKFCEPIGIVNCWSL